MVRSLAVVWLLWCAVGVAAGAEALEFHAPAAAEGAATAEAMRSLAVRALPVYENPDREQFLANLSALQMVAGEYPAADATRDSLHDLREKEKTARPVDEALIYDLYARAMAQAARSGKPFDGAFAQAFRASIERLNDRNAFTLTQWLQTPLSVYRGNLQRELDRLQGKDGISLAQAVDLVWTYLSFEAYRSFGPLVAGLVAADDARRYVFASDVVVLPHRARLSVVVVRPKSAAAPIAALLELTDGIESRDDARECAAQGYAGVIAFPQPAGNADRRKAGRSGGSRSGGDRRAGGDRRTGAGGGDGGADARAVIEWIARQGWSNGRVGLYGSGDSAFAAWAAAEQPLPALKALAATSVTLPAAGGHGRLDPRHRQSAHTDIPVLTTTGYFDSAEATSLAYFEAHRRAQPHADQRLLIGPYDSQAMQRGTLPVLAGYSIDPAAIIDLQSLRFAWFDHVLDGAPLPALLADRVNFEVMGGDAWRHAGSVQAMGNWSVRLFPDAVRTAGHYGLSGHEPSREPLLEERVSAFAGDPIEGDDPAMGIVIRALPSADRAVFVSGPLHRPLEISGRVKGELIYAAPSAAVAVAVRLYELRPGGEYFRFVAIPDALCARCVEPPSRDRRSRERRARRERRLEPRHVVFESPRLTGVELQTGSRIVLVLDASLRAPAQARDPTSSPRDSTARSRARATRASHAEPRPTPEVKWFGGTFVELPVWR